MNDVTPRFKKSAGKALRVAPRFGLNVPGELTRTGWRLPRGLTIEEWTDAGAVLVQLEGRVQWALGDWWVYGDHAYGERAGAVAAGAFGDHTFGTLREYGRVCRAVTTSIRIDVLSFAHHQLVAAFPPDEQRRWLNIAEEGKMNRKGENVPLTVNELKTAIWSQKAIEKTAAAELSALALGKYVVIYADPPWQYEHPPMGGSNRSIERHYPTMPLEEIKALPVADIANDDAALFLWATNPKLPECLEVINAWGFSYRTQMVWVKDKEGMGYYVRNKHECLLIATRGELPVPPVDCRVASVIEAPRGKHSEKPEVFREIIESLYANVTRKIELFAREQHDGWAVWGNEVHQ